MSVSRIAKEPAMPPKVKPAAAPAAIVVTSKTEGFRRAGRAWSKTPTTVLLSSLDAAALAAIEGDPMLTVTRVTADAGQAAG